jgi:hypothetical protein
MKTPKTKYRSFYLPPAEGLVPDPLREAIYGKVPGVEEVPAFTPVKRLPIVERRKIDREIIAAVLPQTLVGDEFLTCYLSEPVAGEILGVEVVTAFQNYPLWRLERIKLITGEVVYRLLSGEPHQIGLYKYIKGVLSFAPTNQDAFIPGAVIQAGEQYILNHHLQDLS